jgi:LPXTG-motif cell wall-anchored protein
VLDTPFPSSNGLNGVSIYRWITVKATLEPYVPCTGCSCDNSCPIPKPNYTWVFVVGLIVIVGASVGIYLLKRKRK